MSGAAGLRKYIWRGRDRERRDRERERRDSRSSHTPSPYLSPRPSPCFSPRPSPRISPRPSPLLTPKPPRNRRHSRWQIPTFLRRKLDRNSGRAGRTAPLDTCQGAVSVTGQAFQDPLTYKNPYAPSFSDPLQESLRSSGRRPSPYIEPEIHDVGGFREPKYLDLFEPGVQVVRDPKLDLPRRTWKERLRPLFATNLGAVAPTKFVIGCCFLLIVLIIGISAIVYVAKLLRLPLDDPRISFPFVTTATSCGLVKGVIENGCYVFRGIPYALQPLKELRLRPAKIPSSLDHCWTGNYSANATKPCWTYDHQGTVESGFEDCLLLDVYTPKLGYENPLPVIVYIGGASLGTDTQRPRLMGHAPKLAVEKQIVLVSPQIRRGLLGFMPSPILAASTYPHTSGNQGASDLMASLVWVNHNIEHFGGDKSKVTLLGHQAGAALSWPLIRRARAKNLVHSAWLSGAAPLHPKVMWRNANYALARPFNCSEVTCITQRDAHDIMEAISLEWRRSNGRPWLVGDGVYIPIEEETPQVPIMFGATEQSAAEYLMQWRYRLSSMKDVEKAVLKTFREIQEFNPIPPIRPLEIRPPPAPWNREPSRPFEMNDTIEAIRWYSLLKDNPWLQLTTVVSDATVTCPLLQTAASLARQWDHSQPSSRGFVPPIYSYVSQHQRAGPFGGLADSLSDIEAILGVFRPLSVSDINFAATMQNLFYTFVETGAPERYYATPAHHGVYVVKEQFTVQRYRRWCDIWTNWEQLIRTF